MSVCPLAHLVHYYWGLVLIRQTVFVMMGGFNSEVQS